MIPQRVEVNSSKNQLNNYHILDVLHAGAKSLVYRAKCTSNDQAVILKLLRNEYPNFNELIQFRNQYTITKNLNLSGVVQPLALESYRNSLLLVMPETGCIALSDYIKTHTLSLAQFLKIAIALATTLEALYHHRIIHKDIKPANILIHPQSLDIKLIDFSIASCLPKETQEIKNINILEGTLSYISPEQTGRMNRGIDYRTDFYSLGVTFYELLTGRLPFESTDAMELVHGHLAKPIPALQEFSREPLPDVLPEIIMKLMAKNAENRYQSAWGLKFDLEKCLFQLQDTGKIERFKIGTRDISDRFLIPEKLYGREAQVQELLNAFNRVACPETHKKCSEIILISGYSGVGKTAVVNEIHKPIVKQRGYFIKGKFDQFQRNIPLSAFLQALRNLIEQLLSESDTQLQNWKEQILNAVGENGQVMIEVIPELEKIIGQQPPVAELSGTAAQNRFHLLFKKFIRVFTIKKHPLVIFLDDLQWADSTSLKLIQLLISETESQYLLLIGAYRDNEVNPAHPLMLTLDEIHKNQEIINTITLAPLQQHDLNQLVTDTLHCSFKQALPLAQAVYQKTKGNPFFVLQFLKVLYEDKLIKFNQKEGLWQCDLVQVKLAAVSEDIVEFVGKRLQKLNPSTQEALKMAACIGNQFDLETLAIVRQTSEQETATDLWPALKEGLILPTTEVYKFYTADTQEIESIKDGDISARYKFLHDRVQQAAYSLIAEAQKSLIHLSIGRRLRHHTQDLEKSTHLFEITNHLNLGSDELKTTHEQEELAQLNLIAGRVAQTAAAYATAAVYFKQGLSLLPTSAWESHYSLTLSLYQDAAEATYLSAEFDTMERFICAVHHHAKTLLDKIKVYEVQIQAYMAQGQPSESIRCGLQVLRQLDVHLPPTPEPTDFDAALKRTFSNLAGRDPRHLVDLPLMTDTSKLVVVRILKCLFPCAYQAAPMLLPLLVMEQVNLSMQYGNTALSASGYVYFGLILCGVTGELETGYQFGQLSLTLVNRLNAAEVRAESLFIFNADILHYQEPVLTTLPALQEAYTIGLETGNLEFSSLATYIYAYHAYATGQNLAQLNQEIANYNQTWQQLKQQNVLHLNQILQQAIANLLGQSSQPCSLSGEIYDQSIMLPLHQQANDATTIYYVYFNQMILCYLLGDFSQAITYAQKTEQYLHGVTANLVVPLFYFYDSLCQLAVYDSLEKTPKSSALLTKVEDNQKKMEHWTQYAPMNYQHKFYLVEAERHRVLGKKLEAIELYDQAIAGAKKNEYLQEEALANEQAAKFYLDWHKTKIAQTYMIEAYYCYSHWGAKAKVQDLEKHYPELLSPILLQNNLGLNPFQKLGNLSEIHQTQQTLVSSTNLSESLDFTSIIKASQALSSEMELGKLMAHLMQVTLEIAGASDGSLILLEDGMLVIQAQSKGANNCYLESFPVESSDDIPKTLINYVYRKQEILVINDLKAEIAFANDSYLNWYQPQSILCLPILNRRQFIGILYLENNLIKDAFTEEKIEVIKLLCSQAAISLKNAELYQQSKKYSHQLEQSLQDLKAAQLQLIQSEKMSALGQMMAGIAHEINNPVGFIAGNISPAEEYLQDLIEHLNLYQEELSNPSQKIKDHAEDIELDYLLEDLPALISSMKTGVNRIRNISSSMRTFSRSDTCQKVICDIHEGLDSTLLILKHRLKADENRPEIVVIKNQGDLPPVKCYPGQLNQVFMNILANAIDAFDEMSQSLCCCQNSSLNTQAVLSESSENYSYTIWIETEFITETKAVEIRIKDNGMGIPKEVKEQIFDHLFTTKPVGKGTGLGLSISRQIIEEKHGGKLDCISTRGQGTKFVIQIPEE